MWHFGHYIVICVDCLMCLNNILSNQPNLGKVLDYNFFFSGKRMKEMEKPKNQIERMNNNPY